MAIDTAYLSDSDFLQETYEAVMSELRAFIHYRTDVREFFFKHCELQREVFKEPLSDDFLNYLKGSLCFFSYIPRDVLYWGSRFLDVGFGEGRMLMVLQTLYGMRGYGVDKYTFSETARFPIQKTIYTALLAQGASCISPYDIEKEHLPYPDETFSLVLFQQVIEHLHNSPKLIVDEITRTMRKGGVLVLDTPNHAFWLNRIKLLKGETVHWDLEKYYNYEFSSGHSYLGDYFGHTREFTTPELVAILEYAGLKVETAVSTSYVPAAQGKHLRSHFLTEMAKALKEALDVDVTFKNTGHENYGKDNLLPTSLLVARKP